MMRSITLLLVGGMFAACTPAPQQETVTAAEEEGVSSGAAEYPDPTGAWEVHRADFEDMMERGRRQGLDRLPVGERATGFARYFLGAPYVAHTLELPGPERLVVNLKELDCVTLIENALALATVAARQGSFTDFLRELETLRYRSGSLDGYTSRLHYFSDWLQDAERKGLVRDVTRELGGVADERRIHFMTSNRDAYRQLRQDPALVDSMRRIEEELTRQSRHWIPQERIAAAAAGIQEGDIIGITTGIDGLDISHTGLATWVDGRLHLLHAPDVGQPVEISRRPLAEHLRANRLQTGIVVARAIDR
jgi:hypothetical protein